MTLATTTSIILATTTSIIEKIELSFQFIMGQFDLARATEVQREPINDGLNHSLNRTQFSREHLRWREWALGRWQGERRCRPEQIGG